MAAGGPSQHHATARQRLTKESATSCSTAAMCVIRSEHTYNSLQCIRLQAALRVKSFWNCISRTRPGVVAHTARGRRAARAFSECVTSRCMAVERISSLNVWGSFSGGHIPSACVPALRLRPHLAVYKNSAFFSHMMVLQLGERRCVPAVSWELMVQHAVWRSCPALWLSRRLFSLFPRRPGDKV